MANAYTLDFEKPLLELERQIDELKRVGEEREIDVAGELTTCCRPSSTACAKTSTGASPRCSG